jgi:dTDP-4-amino-4,6-dideoxy-D-galactose acyltransferase
VKLAEQEDFHFTDIRLTFDMQLREKQEVGALRYPFGVASEAHVDHLKQLTQSMYKDSRYFYDGHFEVEKLNAFYANWIEKAVHGTFDDECLCLFDAGLPIGFCTIKYVGSDSASIGLFGMDTRFTGKGLAKMLLCNVFNRLIDKGVENVTVVTQGRNYAAQRLYQSVGFRTQSTQLWYHKWI